eukprot:4384870-Pyramimonas_sp.AAC.1
MSFISPASSGLASPGKRRKSLTRQPSPPGAADAECHETTSKILWPPKGSSPNPKSPWHLSESSSSRVDPQGPGVGILWGPIWSPRSPTYGS